MKKNLFKTVLCVVACVLFVRCTQSLITSPYYANIMVPDNICRN